MSEILNLAVNFQRQSAEQARLTEQALKKEFQKHEENITSYLNASAKSLQDAINEYESSQISKVQLLMSVGWIKTLVSLIALILLGWGILWWTGHKIKSNVQVIAEQKQTVSRLKELGGDIHMSWCGPQGNRQLCIQIDPKAPRYSNNMMVVQRKK